MFLDHVLKGLENLVCESFKIVIESSLNYLEQAHGM